MVYRDLSLLVSVRYLTEALDKRRYSMDFSSKTAPQWLHWPCAALVLTLAGPAFAHDDEPREERGTVTKDFPLRGNNRCYGPKAPLTGEHPGEELEGTGTYRETKRTTTKRDSVETRTRVQINGRAVGMVSHVNYIFASDDTTTLRMNASNSGTVQRYRETGIPERSRDDLNQPVPRYFYTQRVENGVVVEDDVKCSDRRAKERDRDD
jgi:hypothetical protein